jgi:DNA replication and repair protein RecF
LEVDIIEKITGLRPIVLLDDVFSELDGNRQEHLTGLMKRYQTIISAAEHVIVNSETSYINL